MHNIQWISWNLPNELRTHGPIFIHVTHENGLIISSSRNLTVDGNVQAEFIEMLYIRPDYRIAPYLVGIDYADIYMNTKDKVRNMKVTW